MLNRNDYRTIYRAIFGVVGVLCLFSVFVTCESGDELDAQGVARRPLVIINGQTQQIPTADYVSTAGGLSTNATAAVANDIQTTTLATGALNTGVIAASMTGSQNDWNPTGLQTAEIVQITVNTQVNLTGLTAPTGNVGGRRVCLQNVTAGATLSLIHESSSSSAANRFSLVTGNTWQLVANMNATACFFYDATASRWRQLAFTYFPRINAGSSGQFSVATNGATATTTAALSGFANAQTTDASTLSVDGTITFALDTTPVTSYGVKSTLATTRSSGTAALTNIAGYFSATAAQVNNAIVADAGDVLLNKTSGSTKIGTGAQTISTGAPSVNNGSLGTGSTNWVGNVTGVGANTSVTLTFSAAFASRSWCFAMPNATGQVIYVTNSASAPVFNCLDMAGVAANCVDFSYQCVGQ